MRYHHRRTYLQRHFLIRSLSLDSSEQPEFAVSTPVSTESLGELRADIARAVAAGLRKIIIDIDDIGILDSSIIAALITSGASRAKAELPSRCRRRARASSILSASRRSRRFLRSFQ